MFFFGVAYVPIISNPIISSPSISNPILSNPNRSRTAVYSSAFY
ncbi:hypothetical protein ENHYD8BJ_50302 [Enhydrobacter sp. 8BJ]|nr:hypothetical protein ENHYD8BJ_50302 [Enhydrobacter sp. 8BJ]